MSDFKKTNSTGAVLLNANGLVAVVSQHGTSWSLPKGHIEDGESAQQALTREIKEETGITNFQIVKELGTYARYKIAHYPGEVDDKSELKSITVFLCTTKETTLSPKDSENPEARWVPRDQVANLLTHPKDKEFFESILSQLP